LAREKLGFCAGPFISNEKRACRAVLAGVQALARMWILAGEMNDREFFAALDWMCQRRIHEREGGR
jgi:hypothetical protein